MAQLTIYMDDDTVKQIEKAAHAEHRSVSKWIKNRIIQFFQKEWAEDFMKTLGSLKDVDLKIAEKVPFDHDRPREEL